MTTIIQKTLCALLVCLVSLLPSFGQQPANIGIGTKDPDKTAVVEMKSTTQGLLLPRLTTAQRDAISLPALGLTIYNVDNNCIESWTGTDWVGNCGVTKAVFAITDCGSVTIGPTPDFKEGQSLNPTSNALTLTLNVTKPGTYIIQAGPTSQNGYFFNASGTFSSKGTVVLTIPGIGTPTKPTTPTALDTVILVLNGDTAACRKLITVLPSAIPPAFTLTCGSAGANGIAVPGSALNAATNTISIQISGGGIGSTYNLTTNTVNGMTFGPSSGLVTSNPQTITLSGSGTPVTGGMQTFAISSNGTITPGATCPVNYTVVYPKMNIATFTGDWYGVDMNGWASQALINAPANFGPSATSTVVSQGFTVKATRQQAGGSIASYLSSNFPDIIVLGYAYYTNAADQTALKNYLNNKGVVFYFSENSGGAGIPADVNAILGYPAGTLSGGGGQTTSEALLAIAGDPVLNGPFGDLSQGGKYWGNDGGGGNYITGLPAADVAIYSQYNGGASMFRSKVKNFIFVGDGGFIAGGSGNTQTNYLPVSLSATGVPLGKTYLGPAGGTVTVDNAKLLGNMLAWAIKQAMLNGKH